MKFTKIVCTFFVISLTGCYPNLLNESYKEIGTFDTKVEAQNKAVAYILNQYGSLPQNKYYKVLYSFRNVSHGDFNRNAMWYNKESNELAIEVDINSGIACQWKEVNKTILEQAAVSTNSLSKIDSLSKPNKELSQSCL